MANIRETTGFELLSATPLEASSQGFNPLHFLLACFRAGMKLREEAS